MNVKIIFDFLLQLKNNNNREWFHENKPLYQKSKQEFELLTEVLINIVKQYDPNIGSPLPKDCIFRIFRDVRFSKDKSPYKTNFGAFVVKGGRNSGHAGYYFHLDPEGSFLAGGVYMPPSPVLKSLRQGIYEHAEEFLEIIKDETFIRQFGEIEGEKLKTAPKGFPKDYEYIDLLKFKSYTVLKNIPDITTISQDALMEEMHEVYATMASFNQFINHILNEYLRG